MTFVLWSWRKRQWWKANREGYTPRISEAGRYDFHEAADITIGGLPGSLAVDAALAEKQFADFTDAETIEQRLDEWKRI